MSKELAQGTPDSSRFGKRLKNIASAATGNLVEYFDFYIYGTFAHYFQHAIIPPGYSDTAGQIYVWGVFAASFLMRPVGSWLFGVVGDRYGRKISMIASISIMGLGSILFACLPTYTAVGAWAPFLLLFVRLLQGLSVGGEYGMVATYLSEMGVKGHRGLMTSFQYCMLVGGQLLASFMAAIAAFTVSDSVMQNWGWRIPFLIGGLASFLSLWARMHLEESISSEVTHHQDSGSMISLLTKHTRSFLLVALITAGGSMMFYIVTMYSRTYIGNLGVDNHDATVIQTISLFVLVLVQPLFGMFADKFSTRLNMLLFTGLSIIAVYPVYVWAIPASQNNDVALTLLIVMMMMILAFYTSINALVKADLFPAHIRALGVSFAFAVGNAIFGGTAPTIALTFKNWGYENAFYIYAMVIMTVGFICSLMLPKKSLYLDKEQEKSAVVAQNIAG